MPVVAPVYWIGRVVGDSRSTNHRGCISGRITSNEQRAHCITMFLLDHYNPNKVSKLNCKLCVIREAKQGHKKRPVSVRAKPIRVSQGRHRSWGRVPLLVAQEWSKETDAGFVGQNNAKVVSAHVISIGSLGENERTDLRSIIDAILSSSSGHISGQCVNPKYTCKVQHQHQS